MLKLRKILNLAVGSVLLLSLPILANAQTITKPNNFKDLVGIFLTIISRLIPIIFALTFTVLVFFIIKDWVLASDEKSVESGKRRLVIGVVVLAVMFGVWGLVSLLKNFLSIN